MDNIANQKHRLYFVDAKGREHEVKTPSVSADLELPDGTKYLDRLEQAFRNLASVTVTVTCDIRSFFRKIDGKQKALIRAIEHAVKFFRPSCRKCKHMCVEKHAIYFKTPRKTYHCKILKFSCISWNDEMATRCKFYKRKGKSKR